MSHSIDKIRFKDFYSVRFRIETVSKINCLLVHELSQEKEEQFIVVALVSQIASENLNRKRKSISFFRSMKRAQKKGEKWRQYLAHCSHN